MKIVVDTNIVFSALLKDENYFRTLLMGKIYDFYSCRFLIVEIFKQKEKIVKVSSMKEEDIFANLYEIVKNIEFYNEDLIGRANRGKAYELCKDIDEKDTPFVALTLELGGLLWTGDRRLKNNLSQKGFDRFFNY